jgi:hypothetical protein
MGVSRLLAKIWIVVCLFTGAHALYGALMGVGDVWSAALQVSAAVALFAAMGLLFAGGYGVSQNTFGKRVSALLHSGKPAFTLPLFNDAVFLAFAALSFADQVWYAPQHVSGPVTDALEAALYFAVPGHAVMVDRLSQCTLDGGRVFASSFAWLLAFVFVASAVSRLRHTAEAMQRDRALHPQSLSPTGLAGVLGIAAIIAIQCLFVGAPLALIPCSHYAGLSGALLIGLAPLVFAYVIYAALAALLASAAPQ